MVKKNNKSIKTVDFNKDPTQLNLAIVALVALVAIVGLVALVLNVPQSSISPSVESASPIVVSGTGSDSAIGSSNIAGDARRMSYAECYRGCLKIKETEARKKCQIKCQLDSME